MFSFLLLLTNFTTNILGQEDVQKAGIKMLGDGIHGKQVNMSGEGEHDR